MRYPVRQLLAVFSPVEHLRFIGVVVAMLLMGILQMVGVGVVLPLVSLIADPGEIWSNAALAWACHALDSASVNNFLILIGSVLLFVLLASSAFNALTI